MTKKLCFICTGNTCRSVMAQFFAQKKAADLGLELEISSAGLAVNDELRPPDAVKELLELEGVKVGDRAPVSLTQELADSADLLLVMTREHRQDISARFPSAAGKTSLLAAYAGFGEENIADPYGQGKVFYHSVFKLIKSAVNSTLEKLQKK